MSDSLLSLESASCLQNASPAKVSTKLRRLERLAIFFRMAPIFSLVSIIVLTHLPTRLIDSGVHAQTF